MLWKLVCPLYLDWLLLHFLQQLPELVRCLPGGRLQAWIRTGLDIAAQNESAGQAYFALESVTAHERLRVLQGQVSFGEAQRVLQMYTEGIRFELDLDLVSSEAKVLMLGKQTRIEAEQAVFDLAGKVYRFNNTRTVYNYGDS